MATPGQRLTRHRVFNQPDRSILKLAPDQVAAVRALNQRIRDAEIPFERVACVCGSKHLVEIAQTDRFGLLQPTAMCKRCGLVQSNPRMTDDAYRRFYESDEYRRIYEGEHFLEACEANYVDGRGEEIFARVTECRPGAQIHSVLEFGSAGGWNLVPFLRAGIEVTGYDYSPELVALGRSRGINLIQGGLENVAGSYDVIVLSHVVEHFTDVPGSLRALRSHLHPHGFVHIEVPDVGNFHIGQLQNAHTYYFTRRTLEFCAALGGLRMVDHRQETTGHMSAIFVASQEPPPLDVSALDGHYEEMTALVRRFERRYRLRAPVRAARRVLEAVGLEEPVRRLIRGG